MNGITDFHVHAFPDHLASKAVSALEKAAQQEAKAVLDGTVGDLLRSMDRAGIERSVVCSLATRPGQVVPIINWSLAVRSERIVPFGSVHPDCEDMAGEVARITASGLAGIKLHPMYQGFEADARRMWPCYSAIQREGLILVLHCGLGFASPPDDDRAHPDRVLAVHREFPDMTLVTCHMGGWRQWEAVARTLAGTDVYLETSFSFDLAPPDVLADILERHCSERILFGTDSPWQDQAVSLALVRRGLPDPEVQRQVLGSNAERLLREVAGGRARAGFTERHEGQ